MRKAGLFLLLFLLCFSVRGQRKSVGLVLGGGGAKGAAHVGAIKVLEDAGIPVDYIAGTSIGAIVGSFYAMGHSTAEIDSLIHHLDWNWFLSNQSMPGYRTYRTKEREWKYVLSIPLEKKISIPAGIVTGQNIFNLLSELSIGYHDLRDFDKLPVPFACVATDLSQGKSVILKSGSLPLALRASMSIPGVFIPVQTDSMVLVDGGVLNNLPTNVALQMGAQVTIGIDLSSDNTADNKQLNTFPGMVNKLVDMLENPEYVKNKEALDVYIAPDLKEFNAMSFNQEAIDTMYWRGVAAAKAKLPEILALKAKIFGKDTLENYLKNEIVNYWSPKDTVHIRHIRFDSIPEKEQKWFLKKTTLKEDTVVTVSDINRALAILQGMDLFSSVTYHFSSNAPYDLIFKLQRKALNQINFGFRFDTECMASILLNTTLYHRFLRGSEISLTAKLDKNPYLTIGYNWGPGIMNKIDLEYRLGYQNYNLFQHKKRIDNLYYLWQSGKIMYLGNFRNFEIRSGLEWNYFGYSNELYNVDYNPLPVKAGSFLNYFAKFNYDTYDNRYYPTRGWDAHLETKIITDNFIGYNGFSPIGAVSFGVSKALKLSSRLYVIPELRGRMVWGEEIPAIYLNYMGGNMSGRYLDQQIEFAGIQNVQLFKNMLLLGKLSLRYNILKKQYIFLNGGYAKSADQLGSIIKGDPIWTASFKYSYASPWGPISGLISYSNWVKEVGVYINMGYYF